MHAKITYMVFIAKEYTKLDSETKMTEFLTADKCSQVIV